jgi:hypothetical protein
MKKHFFYMSMLLAAALTFGMTSCSSNDDDDEGPSTDIPADAQAGTAPEVPRKTVNIPNISEPMLESGNSAVIRINLTGIKATEGNIKGEWMMLYGTGEPNQNVWLTIDGKPKSVKVINSDNSQQQIGKADIVFLIDNSGSMDQEADSIAKQVVVWSQVLDRTLDCRFGVVGYGNNYNGIDGGMNLNVIDSLYYFLNERSNYNTGTARTMGFWGKDSANFVTLTSDSQSYFNGSYRECGALALHFADEQFGFRDGANRIYLNFTDEPNQPNGDKRWSVETLNPNDTLYNWNAAKGTVHSVYSGSDSLYYKAPDGSHYIANQRMPFYGDECPWLMSEYTGGVTFLADSYFRNVTLNGLEVTDAMSNSYVLRFNITDDLRTGLHTIILTIKDAEGNMAKKVFENVSFSFQ